MQQGFKLSHQFSAGLLFDFIISLFLSSFGQSSFRSQFEPNFAILKKVTFNHRRLYHLATTQERPKDFIHVMSRETMNETEP